MISVCIPVYNGERYLRLALESVLAQDFGDFEIVIGDDASTDGTRALCRSFADPRIRLLGFDRNLGLAGNWNRTIEACRGTFLKYLAQDDLLAPGALSAFHAAAQRYPGHSFFYCRNEQIGERGEHLRWRGPPLTKSVQAPGELLRMLFDDGNQVGGPTNTFLRTSAVAEVGAFDARCRYALDWILWVQLARRHGAIYLDQPWVRVREHTGSVSHALAGDRAWWDGYLALRVLREREPVLLPWLRRGQLNLWRGLPRQLARRILFERRLPIGMLRHAAEMFRDGIW